MQEENSLPKTGDQHDINADAELCFRAKSPRNWRHRSLEGTDDYGLDFQVQTTPRQRVTDIFRVQLKGTRSPEISSDGKFISIQIKISTFKYYNNIIEPILLVVCNLQESPEPLDCNPYYVWVRDEIRRIGVENLPSNQGHVTLRVPIQNLLTRETDISADLDRQNELSRAGHALDVRVEATHPGMQIEDRLSMVQGITKGITARSAAFLDALAAPVEEHWVAPTLGTLAWHLSQAKIMMRTRSLERVSASLEAANLMLDNATALEKSEYWFLRGKWHMASRADESASSAFLRANQENPRGKYLAAWAEAEIRLRHAENGPKPYSDLLEALIGDEPVILSAKVRVLAAEGKFDEAIDIANHIVGSEHYVSRALVNTIFSKPAEALVDCEAGLALPHLPENARQLLLVLRARAKFSLLLGTVPELEDDVLPPSGPVGINHSLVKDTWEAVNLAIDMLREAGWSSNIDFVADVWGGTASMLGKQKDILPTLIEAARACPLSESVQSVLESLAAQCGEFTIALEANDRLASSQTRNLRRTLLLHEAQKHAACFRFFEVNFDSFDKSHKFFGLAATVAAISAHKMAQPELVKKWSHELESNPAQSEHAAMFQYYLSLELNKLGNDEAIRILYDRYEELGRPLNLAIAILQELNPTDVQQAEKCVIVANRVLENIQPSAAMSTHLALALVTTKNWDPLLILCREFKARVETSPRMLAYEALALDRLGQTEEARLLLEYMLAGGVLDSLALKTYVNIMVRCGYVNEALEAAEKIMESANSKAQRMDCIRLLFNLVQNSDPTSMRLLALATQMGALVDKKSEVEEGIYLSMFLIATSIEKNEPAQQELVEFHSRADIFFNNFPNSKILKKGEFSDNASPEEMVKQIKAIVGLTDDRQSVMTRVENQIQQGLTIIPFFLLPKYVLSTIQDMVHLWEIAKISSIDDKKFHLTMISDINWTPQGAQSLKTHIPLLDLTALLVLFDLQLIDTVLQFFGKIAIAKASLEKLSKLVDTFTGSPMRAKCNALQDALKPHLGSIIQPSIPNLSEDEGFSINDEDRFLGREHKEISTLCLDESNNYRLYSDDLAFRILCAKSDTPNGICTLDVLGGLEEVGLLTRQEVALKISMLCRWKVGVVVRFEELVALIPTELNQVSSVRQGIQILDDKPEFMVVISALWDFRKSYDITLSHAAAVLRRLADETNLSIVALSAVVGQWYVKAGMKKDAPTNAHIIIIAIIIRSVLPNNLTTNTAQKLWGVFKELVEYHYGNYMDEIKERDAIKQLASHCAKLAVQNLTLGEKAFSSLEQALIDGTSDKHYFTTAYSRELLTLSMQRELNK